MATMETKSMRSPNIIRRGSIARNSSVANLEVRMDVKRSMERDEHMNATAAPTKKMWNQSFCPKTGNPSLSNPPGTLIATANAEAAISVATIMQVVEVPLNHSSPSLRRFWCSLAKITSAVSLCSPVLLSMYARGTIFFTTCKTVVT